MRQYRLSFMVLAALAVILAPAANAVADIVYDRTIDTTGQTLGGDITDNVLITPAGSATDGGVVVKIYGGGLVTVQGTWDFRGQNNFLGGAGTLGTLHVDGGTATTDNTLIFNGCVSGGVEGESRLNVSGGTLNLVRAYANQNDSRLYVNQTGGFMNASNTFTVGHGGTQKTNVQAQYVISGGHATFSGLLVGNAGATLTSANCGSGRFEVNGLWTVQGITRTIEVVNSLQLYHTLAFNFGATGVTPIDADTFVLGTTDGANPTIELGVLDGLTAGDVAAGTYDLVRLTSAWTGSLDDIVLVVPAGSGWTVQVSNDGKALQVVIPVSNIPEADAGEDQTVHDDDGDDEETVTLDGSGSHDEGGTIVSYAWSIASTQIATGVAPQVVLPTGTHVITLVVTNDQSGTDDDTVTIVVNKPPVANAGQDQSVEDADDDGLASVTLNGAASSDSDGTVVEYHWFDYDGEPIGSGSSVNASLPVGLHDIGLCVVDNSGGTGWTVVRYWVTPKIDFYVDTNNPGASDTNPGTAALPFKTIGKSVTAVASGSGQAIMVKGGVYREGLNINRPGQDDAGRITLMGAPFEKVVLTGADVLTGWTQCTQQTARNNPNWASIYCKDIDWQPSMLIQDDVALTIASSPENELWSPTATGTTTTFQDTVHLTQQAAGYWLGANLVYRGGVGMSYSRTVTGFDPATGTITFTPAKSTSCVTSDLYFFQHKVEFISGAGQWAVEKVDETTYRVFCWPAGGGTPDSYVVEADHRTYGIKFNTANNHWTFDNLEVRHVQGAGIGYSPTGAGYVVRNCVVRDNAQTGLAFTGSDTHISKCLVTGNRMGITLSGDNSSVRYCEVSHNWEDGIRCQGKGTDKPAVLNHVVAHSYVHHQLGTNHPDSIQTFGNLDQLTIDSCYLVGASQNLMSEQCRKVVLLNNIAFGSCDSSLILGSLEVEAHHNTVIGVGYQPMSWNHKAGLPQTGAFFDNVADTLHTGRCLNVNDANKPYYTADYNAYYRRETTASPVLWGQAYSWTWNDYLNASGQDAHSYNSELLLTNTPVLFRRLSRDVKPTATRIFMTTTGFSVGDNVEINFDGNLHAIVGVGADYIDISPGDSTFVRNSKAQPNAWFVANWGSATTVTRDFTPGAASPALGSGSSGGNMGSTVNPLAYELGDFNGDGRRDVPDAPPDE